MNIKSCYIYTRVSTVAQIDGYSLDAQIKALRDYAEYRELRIAGEYCDAGKSGMNTKNRPEFRQMMEDVISQKDDIEYVLVFKLSRFGRNAADIMRSLQTLDDFGVNLVSVSESIDSSTQGGRLTLAILSAVAEMEHENIVVQFHAGKVQKILNGDWSGGTIPYGYRNIDHKLQLDAYEAEVIHRIYELYIMEGNTATSVAVAMNESSYVLRDMKYGGTRPFTYEFVTRTLDNPFYCGKLYYKRRTNKKDHNGKVIKYGPDHAIMVQGNHETIVSEDLWNTAQEKRKVMAARYAKKNNYTHILSGLVKCPLCGKSLVGNVSRTKNLKGDGYYKAISYYVCRYSGKQNGSQCGFSKRLNQEIIDGIVFEILGKLQYNEEFKNLIERALGADDSLEVKEQKLKDLRIKLRDAEFTKNKLGTQMDSLNPLREDYDEKYDSLSSKLDDVYDLIEECEDGIKRTKKAIDALKRKNVSFDNITDFLINLNILLQKMNDEEKKELCCNFIESIEVFPNDRPDGRVVKSISFKFPLAFDGKTFESDKDDDLVTFVLDCEDIEIKLPEKGNIIMQTMQDGTQKVIVRKPTYAAIKKYVLDKFNAKVSTLYIAQTKRKYGVEIGVAYNKPKEPKNRVPQCTPEKEKMILDAFKHFDLVDESTEYKDGK